MGNFSEVFNPTMGVCLPETQLRLSRPKIQKRKERNSLSKHAQYERNIIQDLTLTIERMVPIYKLLNEPITM